MIKVVNVGYNIINGQAVHPLETVYLMLSISIVSFDSVVMQLFNNFDEFFSFLDRNHN